MPITETVLLAPRDLQQGLNYYPAGRDDSFRWWAGKTPFDSTLAHSRRPLLPRIAIDRQIVCVFI